MNFNDENDITRKINFLRHEDMMGNGRNKRRNYNYEHFLNELNNCVKLQNVYKISKILVFTKLPVPVHVIDELEEADLKMKIKKYPNLSEFENLLIEHFNILKMLCNKNGIVWDKLLSYSCKFLSTFISVYCDNLWMLPPLLSLCFFLNHISSMADFYNSSSSRSNMYTEENEDITERHKYTIDVLNSIRGKIGIVKGDLEKHGAFVILMFQSIKLCMKLNNMQITSSFVKIMNSTDIGYSYIPKSFIVLFKNQLGKLYMQKMEYDKAEKEFIWAFSNSKKNRIQFRKKILESIISIRLNKGMFPPKKLLTKYELYMFIDIVKSIKMGNIFLYSTVMNDHSKYFFDNGLNDCVEQIHFIVKRNLVKIVVEWWNQRANEINSPNKIYKVPIHLFHHIFVWAHITQHKFYLETLGILSSLILSKYINAYISYDTNILVLSKNDPFPSVTQSNTNK